ncbi:MAG: acyltransferase [Candidatus Omnitrophica bacterium]|nr:acyltransferase [Candidatus Omnitrophota bacterium]
MMKTFKLIKDELLAWFEFLFVTNIPGRSGRLLRRFYWSGKLRESSFFNLWPGCEILEPRNITLGKDALLMSGCRLNANDNGTIKIGDRARVNTNVYVGASNGGTIIFGNDVSVGPNVVMRASNHRKASKNAPVSSQGHEHGTIVLEDDVWVGANSVILPNVRIGKGAVIAAGAVVNRDIPSYALAAGVPAKVVKEDCRG